MALPLCTSMVRTLSICSGTEETTSFANDAGCQAPWSCTAAAIDETGELLAVWRHWYAS